MLLFVAAAGSFKNVMVGQITDSMLGHLQVHRKGYVASVDNLPLNLNIGAKMLERVKAELAAEPGIAATSVRAEARRDVQQLHRDHQHPPQRHRPGGRGRHRAGAAHAHQRRRQDGPLVAPGQLLIPELIAKGFKVKVGDTVVLVATNRDGSVNGKNFIVRGVLEQVTGPGGRDGYLHADDARELLRMDEPEVDGDRHAPEGPGPARRGAGLARDPARRSCSTRRASRCSKLHSWKQLSPFANIASMIDLMTLFIRIMLVAIVLVSVMNVMLMAVYERIREIGTLAAIGTPPRRILGLYRRRRAAARPARRRGRAWPSAWAWWRCSTRYPLQFPFGRQVITLQPTLSLAEMITVAVLVVGMAVLASLQPAWRASRMDPIEALRHV